MELIPNRLTAGLPLDYLVEPLTAYPAGLGWALRAIIRGPAVIDLDSVADGDQHRFTATALQSAAWAAGQYQVSVRAIRGAEVVELDFKPLEIVLDFALVAAGTEMRSHAAIVLANIDAVLEKRSTQDQDKYKINNRELWRTPLADLMKLRATYQAIVRKEKAKAAGHTGWGRSIKVRFK